jgi:hypothetical protein
LDITGAGICDHLGPPAYVEANAQRGFALASIYSQRILTHIVVTLMKGESTNFSLAIATSPA